MTLVLYKSRDQGRLGRMSGWVRANFFAGVASGLTTILLSLVALAVLTRFLDWSVLNAVWTAPPGDSSPCRAVHDGACWALVGEKYRFMLFATYPYEAQWRPATACVLLIGLYVISAIPACWRRGLLLVWVAGLVAVAVLMWGGVAGLSFVPQDKWGGLPVTLLLSTFGILAAFPAGILVALGRQATALPAIRIMCIGYIELIRGVPLVSLLFMASFVFPLFLPQGIDIDKLLRAQLALILFSAAYIAEVVRGGLQSVPSGQVEGAMALGLRYWRIQMLIILPQALRNALPPLVSTAISIFKSTSLVLVVGIFDLLSSGKASIVDPAWQGFGLEMFITISLIYFIFCFSMSRYSKYIERRLV
ncbi:amino acid ABC transporter permease [Mesorhizobium sp. B4-1-4]|uniref:amino acid ABC transporter permease n=1 Tax=Mesorhizobium sp. B4-1-4 TaxID=2589888 RepID=UPI00112D3C5E|nr:amino acid ABC transporter permease [Mesorhizobium sp. B4-1-4]UCI31903.1 amino acid ABC transporter permease [Mesorhizobium sp. B4-1-4]